MQIECPFFRIGFSFVFELLDELAIIKNYDLSHWMNMKVSYKNDHIVFMVSSIS